MRILCAEMMRRKLAGQLPGFDKDSPFSHFNHIHLHDGSSFALKSSLQEAYPGRFTKVSPAAVELHVIMYLLSEIPNAITLSADSESEVHYAPEPSQVAEGLLLADRMFFIKSYLADIQRHGGHYIVKTKGTLNPVVRRAWRQDGSEIKRWRERPLKALKEAMAWEKAVDLDVYCTRNVTMCLRGLLFELVTALLWSVRRLKSSLQAALAFLAGNTKRSHPKREREHGR